MRGYHNPLFVEPMSVDRYKSYFKTMTSDRIQTAFTPSGGIAIAIVLGLDVIAIIVLFKNRYWSGELWCVELAYVDEAHRRRGLATELYNYAARKYSPLMLSRERTNDGLAWCKSLEARHVSS